MRLVSHGPPPIQRVVIEEGAEFGEKGKINIVKKKIHAICYCF